MKAFAIFKFKLYSELSRITVSLLINLSLLKSHRNLFYWEAFQNYRFQRSGLNEYTVRKKEANEKRIGLKDYTLNFGVICYLSVKYMALPKLEESRHQCRTKIRTSG